MDYSLPGSSVHGISQAILEWVAISGGGFEGFSVALCHIFLAMFSVASTTRRWRLSISRSLTLWLLMLLSPPIQPRHSSSLADLSYCDPSRWTEIPSWPGIKYGQGWGGVGRGFRCLSHMMQIYDSCKEYKAMTTKASSLQWAFGGIAESQHTPLHAPGRWLSLFRTRDPWEGWHRKTLSSVPSHCFCLVREMCSSVSCGEGPRELERWAVWCLAGAQLICSPAWGWLHPDPFSRSLRGQRVWSPWGTGSTEMGREWVEKMDCIELKRLWVLWSFHEQFSKFLFCRLWSIEAWWFIYCHRALKSLLNVVSIFIARQGEF